jgi:hypothetical protein
MRYLSLFLVMLLLASCINDPPVITHYGIRQDLKEYPQNSVTSCLSSIIKAIEKKRYDYLLAHLIYPDLVKIELGKESFDTLVMDVKENFETGRKNTELLKEFLKDGIQINYGNEAAVLRLMNGSQLQFMSKNKLWYLNRH